MLLNPDQCSLPAIGSLSNTGLQDSSQVKSAREWLFNQYYSGAVQAWVDAKAFVGLEAVADATEYMLSGESMGKVVVDLR